MGFRTGAYASVWEVKEGRGNTMSVRLSVSRKNKDGIYEQDFSGYCTFIGIAKTKAEKLKAKERIKLGDVDVTTWYDSDKGKEYVNYKVFDFEMANGNTGRNNTAKPAKTGALEENPLDGVIEEDDLPF